MQKLKEETNLRRNNELIEKVLLIMHPLNKNPNFRSYKKAMGPKKCSAVATAAVATMLIVTVSRIKFTVVFFMYLGF